MDVLRCLCFEDELQDRARIGDYLDIAWGLVDKKRLAPIFPGKDLSKLPIDFCAKQLEAFNRLRSGVETYGLFFVDFFEKNPGTEVEQMAGVPLAGIARGMSTTAGSILGIVGLTKDNERLFYLERDFKRKASLSRPGPNGTFGYAFYSKTDLFTRADPSVDEVAKRLCDLLVDAAYERDSAQSPEPQAGERGHKLQGATAAPAPLRDGVKISIFISHSNDDVELATSLVRLLDSALRIDSKTIRCSSVPGHQLPPGALTAQALQKELQDCEVVIGLITERSLSSHFVLFELGAAWGMGGRFVPLTGPGFDFKAVRPPLSDYNACKWNERQSWIELIDRIAGWLSLEKNPNPASYESLIDEMIKM